MVKQMVFAITLLITLGVFGFTVSRIIGFFRLTRPAFPVKNLGKRFFLMLRVAFGQTKLFRKPVIGFFHALVFWGFCVILFGSIEMVIDGLWGKEKSLSSLGSIYNIIVASGDIFGLLVAIAILIFLFRRLFFHIKRFEGIEMKKISHLDANIALTMILLLMISLLGMNIAYIKLSEANDGHFTGYYPVSQFFAIFFQGYSCMQISFLYEFFWWMHIVLIFIFANILPYSKHFHVFMSVPNVFLSRLDPLGKLSNMDQVTREVKLMIYPEMADPADTSVEVERFGVKDAEDITWKNYFDALSCTECGRCTSVCPANLTGKKLSPRKIMMDVRARMKEKGPGLRKNGKNYDDKKALVLDYITEEELWACTTCNACAKECPININHPSLILDMRRYLVMEKGSAPGGLKSIFSNIENNGAPWQYSAEDRLLWAKDLKVKVPVMSDVFARGERPEYLFWVGCAGAFDDRFKKVVAAFAKILSFLNVSYAVLGREESCTGDPARRAGNEMLFQMQALQNIRLFESYDIKKIITVCPHCYNVFKNEYPDLGAEIEVENYLHFLLKFINSGHLKLDQNIFAEDTITYHDPCYLGRANDIYQAPRSILKTLSGTFIEMERNKSFALCCGAGGGQMFKEAEQGQKEIFIERTEEALATNPSIIATACPFCMTMITDGIKYKNREEKVKNYDIAEIIAVNLGL